MSSIYQKVIDYIYLSSFDNNVLKRDLIVPIKKDGIYIEVFSCEESNLEDFESSCIIKKIKIEKKHVEFFLSDLDFRIELFKQAQNSINPLYEGENNIFIFFSILIKKAIDLRSSDIHIESMENCMIIRFRIDGTLKLFISLEQNFDKVISSYIKTLSKIDVTNFRTPMDGRFSHIIDDLKYDFRVSTMPTINGESIVIRILDNKTVKKDIEKLGFSKDILKGFDKIGKLRQGLVLITGPTGSGKSTTLYSILKKLASLKRKVITVEDPVEYKLEQIQQIEVNNDLGLSFQTVLKSILRQDPDIILIGEIRDSISLNIALQASLTGHLVLASLHANSSIDTLSRLLDLKADRYLLASSLKYIISQRLVLNICQNCFLEGCEKCNYIGFKGRSCIAESLDVNEEISTIILKNKSLKEYFSSRNFKTIFQDGLEKVDKGITTLEEVYKVVEKV